MNRLVTAERLSLPGRLEETSLTLQPGELTCLIGPNGSGKTSLLHALAGIGSPGGAVRISGVDPWREPPERRQRLLSYLGAARDVSWPISITDLVALGAAPSASKVRLVEIIEEFGLAVLAGRRIDRVSTGEQSRALIARALAPEPRLLLLDEPIANLDLLWQLRLMDYLKAKGRASGQAVLLAIHDVELAGRYADRLIVMDRRRIAADGVPATLLRSDVMKEVFGVERGEGGWRPAL